MIKVTTKVARMSTENNVGELLVLNAAKSIMVNVKWEPTLASGVENPDIFLKTLTRMSSLVKPKKETPSIKLRRAAEIPIILIEKIYIKEQSIQINS